MLAPKKLELSLAVKFCMKSFYRNFLRIVPSVQDYFCDGKVHTISRILSIQPFSPTFELLRVGWKISFPVREEEPEFSLAAVDCHCFRVCLRGKRFYP